MSDLGSVRAITGSAGIPQVEGGIRARGDFVQAQVNYRIVRFDERGVRRAAIGVRCILVVRQNLRRGQLGVVPRELINPPKIWVQAGIRVVVASKGQIRLSAHSLGGIVVTRAGRVAREW